MITMGVDLGIKKIAWSVWDEDVLMQTGAYDSPHADRGDQLMDCSRLFSSMISQIEPDAVVIEETLIGNNKKYSIKLAQMMGAVLAELSISRKLQSFNVVLANVSAWKKDVLGNGNADKKMIQDYISQRDPAYAVLCDHDQDRFDAACIGYYGVILAERIQQLADTR